MGADIHMYIEYVHKSDVERYKKELKEKKEDARKPYVHSFGDRLNPGRNYCMFGCLAKGVRSDIDGAIEPKGLPPEDQLGHTSMWDNRVYITEDGEGDNECTIYQAMSWEKYGRKITYRDDKPIFVENPDWHSYTWLTLKEYKEALDLYKQNSIFDGVPIEYQAVLDLMKSFKKNGAIPKIVFWFDN
jgi:hypothetical protein